MKRANKSTRKPKASHAGRQRGVAVQVYLSKREAAELRAIIRKRGSTTADVLRFWIARASRRRKPPKAKPAADPRQLELENARALQSLDAFTSAARAHGMLPPNAD